MSLMEMRWYRAYSSLSNPFVVSQHPQPLERQLVPGVMGWLSDLCHGTFDLFAVFAQIEAWDVAFFKNVLLLVCFTIGVRAEDCFHHSCEKLVTVSTLIRLLFIELVWRGVEILFFVTVRACNGGLMDMILGVQRASEIK